MQIDGAQAAHVLTQGIGRRRLLQATAGLVAAGAVSSAMRPALAHTPEGGARFSGVLQPGQGRIRGAYLPARPEEVLWGELPTAGADPVLSVESGSIVTVDTVSHEGILDDQGRDPVRYFGEFGVPRPEVLDDAVAIAAETEKTGPGPHVVVGPIEVQGAAPGDVLKVEVLDLQLRVPYGVISNRHGRGALPGEYPERWVEERADDPSLEQWFNEGDNISIFVPAEQRPDGLFGIMPGRVSPVFPLNPFLGLMGVARETEEQVDSVPPTDAGGNADINELGVGTTVYYPVHAPGALFFVGDPHHAQGDGEVALTAMEGSLRATLRLTAVSPGGDAPTVAFDHPFAETPDHWIPIGLSDVDGPGGGAQETSLDLAMANAVRNALAFLVQDLGMEGPVAYAYLSAAADFQVSQVVDRTTGVHALIRKADFLR